MSKKVLIFTYYWPPAGGVAVQRFLKMSKYLPQFGWQPIIVTVNDGSYPYTDDSLLQEVAKDVEVYRTATFEPFELYNLLRGKKGKSLPLVAVTGKQKKGFFQRITEYVRANFFVPDARKGWVPYAVKQAKNIIATQQVDAIITTGPPHSAHLIGLELKKQFNIPWIADLRDPWTGIFYNNFLPRTGATKAKDKALETQVMKTADCVTVISPGMEAEFKDRARNIKVVFNGYDGDDFSHDIAVSTTKLVMRYVGNLMASQNSPALWNAIAELRAADKAFADLFEVELIGRVDAEVKQSIESAGIQACIKYTDFVEHKQAIQLMQQAGALLFIIPDVQDNHLIMTGKLFEYLASRTQILSVGPVGGNAAEVLEKTGRNKMADYADKKLMKAQLADIFSQWQQNKVNFKHTDNRHEYYSRKNQTGLMAEHLNSLLK